MNFIDEPLKPSNSVVSPGPIYELRVHDTDVRFICDQILELLFVAHGRGCIFAGIAYEPRHMGVLTPKVQYDPVDSLVRAGLHRIYAESHTGLDQERDVLVSTALLILPASGITKMGTAIDRVGSKNNLAKPLPVNCDRFHR